MSITDRIPAGWRFYTADWSIPSNCAVTLTRINEHRAAWNAMPDHDREHCPLFVSGKGANLEMAINDAVSNLAPADLLEPATYVHVLGSGS